MPDQGDAQPPWLTEGHPPSLRHAAEALGFLLILWGRLEESINDGVIKLSGVRRALRYELVGHVDFREKLQIIKSLAFAHAAHTVWFDALEKHINLIDNELRPERNRMIHDLWWLNTEAGEFMFRIGFAPKLKRPQARQRILERDLLPISAEEIWDFVMRVVHAFVDLQDLIKQTPKRGPAQRSRSRKR
jgi:hypothetical protein